MLQAYNCQVPYGNEVWVDGGDFIIGENEAYEEERPQHQVRLKGFWIDVHEVTNDQFARFVSETGYVTVAEKTEPTDDEDTPEKMKLPDLWYLPHPSWAVTLRIGGTCSRRKLRNPWRDLILLAKVICLSYISLLRCKGICYLGWKRPPN